MIYSCAMTANDTDLMALAEQLFVKHKNAYAVMGDRFIAILREIGLDDATIRRIIDRMNDEEA